MSNDFTRKLKLACDDVYVDVADAKARTRLQQILDTSPAATALRTARGYRTALMTLLDEVHDGPDDVAGVVALLGLLAIEPPR